MLGVQAKQRKWKTINALPKVGVSTLYNIQAKLYHIYVVENTHFTALSNILDQIW